MADTVSTYNHTAAKLLSLSIDDEASNFYVELLSASASFSATATGKSQVDSAGAYEVAGNGWASGGENLQNVAVSTVTTNDAMIDADDISKTASGDAIGPASAALIYVKEGGSSPDSPLWYVTFDAPKTAAQGNSFNLSIATTGLANITVS